MKIDVDKLASKGRFGDTIVAHINPSEALLLKLAGGAGTINPETGLPEFWGGFGDIFSGISDIISAPAQWTGDIVHNLTGWGGAEDFTEGIKARNDAGLSGLIDTAIDPTGTVDYGLRDIVSPMLPEWLKNIAPQAGSLIGGIVGGMTPLGPAGAAAGAAAGRGIGGKLAGQSYVDTVQGAIPAAALAYGGAKVLQGTGAAADGSSTIPVGENGAYPAVPAGENMAYGGYGSTDYTSPFYGEGAGAGAGGVASAAVPSGVTGNAAYPEAGDFTLPSGTETAGAAKIPGQQEPGFFNNVGSKISKLFSMDSASNNATKGGANAGGNKGMLDTLNNNKLLLALMGSGLYSSYATGKENADIAEKNRQAMQGAIEKESWNPTNRAEVGRAIDAENANSIAALLKRTGGAAAESGRGGGFYGSAVERANQAARENKANFINSTYAPNPNLIPYLAQATGASPSATSGITSGIGQTAGNILPYLLAMQMMGK